MLGARTKIQGISRLMLFFLLGTFSTHFAQSQDAEGLSDHSSIQVKYIGGDHSTLLFNLKYANKDARSLKLVALSENGDVWFQENYRMSKELDKKLTIPRLTETGYIVFLLRSSADEKELTYTVTVPRKSADDTSLTN